MSNQIVITDLAAKSAVKGFYTKAKYANTVDRSWEPEFKQTGYDPGTQIRLRRPARLTGVQSSVATPQNLKEDSVTLVVQPYNVSVPWTDLEKQLSLRPEKLEERVFKPMVNALIAQVEATIAQTMAQGSILDAGNTPGTVPSNFRSISDAIARLQEQRIPDEDEIFGAYTYGSLSALLDNTKSLLNPSTQIGNQFLTGKIKNVAGVNMFGSPSVYRLNNGTGVNSSTPLVNGAVTSGTSIVMDGCGASKTYKKGQAFTITTSNPVYEVDPQSFTALPKNKVFRLAADATSDGSGNLTVTVTETIAFSGTTQNMYSSSASIADNAVVNWYNGGSASSASYQNLIYAPFSTACVFLPPALPEIKGLASIKTYDGIPVKAEFWRDAGNHQEFLRMDILMGVQVLRGNWIVTAWGE